MKHKTYFANLILAVVMTGCLKVQKKDVVAAKAAPKAKPQTVEPKQILTRELRLDDVFVEYIGQAQPNLYDVAFSWPATKDRVRLSMSGQALFTANTQETLHYELSNVQGGRKISVLIEILDLQNHVIFSETRDLEIPKDYIFPKNYRLTADMTIPNERVFMSSSVITTQNFNLTIKTKKLIVLEKSYIQGFALSDKAQPTLHGRNGGEIRIEADSAEGDLEITMNSEAGGDGFKGVDSFHCSISANFCIPSYNCPGGGSGMNAGQNGNLVVKIKDVNNLKLYPQVILSEGGNVGPSFDAETPQGYPLFMNYSGLTCPKSPARGEGASEGKICLTFSGQASEPGCE